MDLKQIEFIFNTAANTTEINTFLELIFPEEWRPAGSRILESGVTISKELCEWAPRLSPIPFVIKTAKTQLEADFKTCMYRIHDCFHQLWGLPIPSKKFTEEEFYNYKKAQLCGEVAVLTISEFLLAQKLLEKYPLLEPFIIKRCAVPMLNGPLKYKSPVEIGMRLDELLHKKIRPYWARNDIYSTKFADYYVPMLEDDRKGVDHNWACMKQSNWSFENAPNTPYNKNLSGLELTIWMIEDFFHQTKTGIEIDIQLMEFNQQRRKKITFPEGWGKH